MYEISFTLHVERSHAVVTFFNKGKCIGVVFFTDNHKKASSGEILQYGECLRISDLNIKVK